ncbi:XdhC family protein [Propionispira raffinosivorans]|uniref:XdhC family protein n=1 Tax=Propionispira raffinosivorans TaxID=86959 RepID=UPI0003821F4A|nr:XdhC family protein [Propionispira raffinosivorans]
MDITLIPHICESLKESKQVVLATIVETKGSTPRKTGSQMLIFPDGQVRGTIGGGCGEADVKMAALCVFDAGKSSLHTVTMLNGAASEEGMACGGIMQVFLQLVG